MEILSLSVPLSRHNSVISLFAPTKGGTFDCPRGPLAPQLLCLVSLCFLLLRLICLLVSASSSTSVLLKCFQVENYQGYKKRSKRQTAMQKSLMFSPLSRVQEFLQGLRLRLFKQPQPAVSVPYRLVLSCIREMANEATSKSL